jgi:4-hydroxybenzoate polyprenyltransferase
LTRKRETQLGVSAVTFLALSVWIGPTAACWLIGLAAIVAVWAALCRRFPVVGTLTEAFFRGFLPGLISGLFGYRGGYGYYRAARRRRR